MQTPTDHHNLFLEGISRARLIREDLKNALTEYEPRKVRGLNRAYIETIKEVIRQGEYYLDKGNDFKLGLKIGITIENYKAFLSTMPRLNNEEE